MMLGNVDEQSYFEIDESFFGNKNNKQIWLLGIVNTTTKQFRVEGTYSRDGNTITKIISKHIASGNFIITDGWSDYNYLDNDNSGYANIKHNHGGDFGLGRESTSHIESIWPEKQNF